MPFEWRSLKTVDIDDVGGGGVDGRLTLPKWLAAGFGKGSELTALIVKLVFA